MQIVFALDHKEDEEWLNRKVQTEGFALSVPELTALLAISPYSLRSYFNQDVPYIKNSGRVCYCQSKVDEWLMKHAAFTMTTRTLNLLDFVSMAEIEKAEQETGERFGMLMERDLEADAGIYGSQTAFGAGASLFLFDVLSPERVGSCFRKAVSLSGEKTGASEIGECGRCACIAASSGTDLSGSFYDGLL